MPSLPLNHSRADAKARGTLDTPTSNNRLGKDQLAWDRSGVAVVLECGRLAMVEAYRPHCVVGSTVWAPDTHPAHC